MPDVDFKKPRVLTERKIRENIKSFSEACRDVRKADAQRLTTYEKLGVELGVSAQNAS